jgi:eukaryotic-like serine/threonine-protein kinase
VIETQVARPASAPAVIAGRYELGPLLGRGASAVVHRASDRHTGGTVALKLFPTGASATERGRQQREVHALAALHHPGLVGLRDGGVDGGRPYIVTDLVEGPTLAARIAQQPLTADEVCSLGAQLADALAHVHAGGIVHRDLKPANVLLGADHRPRLADFGIARALDGTAVTGTGYIVGTAAYLAPEQVRGEDVGPAADVYALGLVLLEALTGRREYPGALVESALSRLHRPPAIPDDAPDGLREAVESMTALDPAARPTAAQAAMLLGPGGAWGRGRAAHRGPDRRGRPARQAAAGVAAVAVAASVSAAVLPAAVPPPALAAALGTTMFRTADTLAWVPELVPIDRAAGALAAGSVLARQELAAAVDAVLAGTR